MSEPHVEIPVLDRLWAQADADVECKGDLIGLQTGCKSCRKCRKQMLELVELHHANSKTEQQPQIVHHTEMMMRAGQVMGHALRFSKGDLIEAQTLLKIAAAAAETITQMESVRVMMQSVMNQTTGRKSS